MRSKRCLTDTTLTRLTLKTNTKQRLELVRLLDELGVVEIQISSGISAKELSACHATAKKSNIVTCVPLEPKAVLTAMEHGSRSVHLKIPASYSLIYMTMGKNKDWVRKNLLECRELLLETGAAASVVFMGASQADTSFLSGLTKLLSGMSISRVWIEDTLGIQSLSACAGLVEEALQMGYKVGYDGSDDLGMAVANTVQALKSGANAAACTLGGAGRGCDLCSLIHVAKPLFDFDIDKKEAKNLEKHFRELFGL